LINLNLSNNKFNGHIPIEISKLVNLNYLNLSNNKLDGMIPINIYNIEKLTYLNLSNNLLEGPIPIKIKKLINLIYLDLSYNLIKDQLPYYIFTLDKLEVLKIQYNEFYGNLPLFELNINILEINIGKNKLTGLINNNISELQNLIILNLRKNKLTGNIPHDLPNSLTTLNLSGNYFINNNFDNLSGIITKYNNLFINLNSNYLTFDLKNKIKYIEDTQYIETKSILKQNLFFWSKYINNYLINYLNINGLSEYLTIFCLIIYNNVNKYLIDNFLLINNNLLNESIIWYIIILILDNKNISFESEIIQKYFY